ncbi:hypothetical protein B0H13DRAFT_2113271 [Mycena leptocephala]|nr:hypothetical protein B0H13DRAFT_2113271 [Mycena leptocephala]
MRPRRAGRRRAEMSVMVLANVFAVLVVRGPEVGKDLLLRASGNSEICICTAGMKFTTCETSLEMRSTLSPTSFPLQAIH